MNRLSRTEKSLWFIFLVWSSVGLISIFTQTDADTIRRLVSQPQFRSFFISCLTWGDFVFHVLAAGNLLFALSAWLGWRKTWTSFVVIGVLSAITETIGTKTGFLFGPYFYTERMGPMLGGTLPLAIPFAWWNILGSFYMLARYALPRLGSRSTSLLVAALATILDWVMEPFAWKIRGYWIWENAHIPLQNYVGWFVLSFALCRISPLHGPYRPELDKRCLAVPVLMLTFFISARLLHGV
jgi:putative membrane protein